MRSNQTWHEVPELSYEIAGMLSASVVLPTEAGQRAIETAFERNVLPGDPGARIHNGPYPVVQVNIERDDVFFTVLTPRPRTVVLNRRFLLWPVESVTDTPPEPPRSPASAPLQSADPPRTDR